MSDLSFKVKTKIFVDYMIMEVVANNYLPGDQRLVDKIVYELKSQGIFDQFRKECFADVDTKPAYQNLRQRVEGSVTGFLKEQSWRPDMNKNQVREMLRKTITESGYLETGVERIVDQVVNPKINSVFLPKVEEVVYNYLGIKKPNRNEAAKSEQSDLLPTDLEAVSPESEPVDKKDDKSTENLQELDESKTEEDESPPFEPLDEQSVCVPQEENSVDSHLSGFSGLISHESNQSNENKVSQVEQDSQMSRNSSDSRLSIVTSDENSKMDICEDSQSKSIKSTDSNHKDDKNKHKSSDKHKSRSESKSDKDRKNNKDTKTRHSSSSKDKDKSRDRKDSKSSGKNEKPKDKDRAKSGSSGKHSSNNSNKDKNVKKELKESLGKDKSDKGRSSNQKESKPRDKSSDSRSKEKSSSSDKHKHSSSSHSDRHKKEKDKERKKDNKSKDDHYSSKDKKGDRRSTDRDSNDGQSSKQVFTTAVTENNASKSQKTSQDSSSHGTGDSGNSDQAETTTKAPVVISGEIENSEITIASPETQKVRVLKPKCASNIQEALRLMKIRKQLAKLEKQNQLSLASVDVTTPILLSSSINLEDLKENGCDDEKSEIEVVPSPLRNTIISQDNWDAMEAKLRQEVDSEFNEYNDESHDSAEEEADLKCKYFNSVDLKQIEFLQFVDDFIKKTEKYKRPSHGSMCKRKIEDDLKNNNNKKLGIIPEKKRKITKKFDGPLNGKFVLPLSPAESDKSVGKKEDVTPLKAKRNSISKVNSQRYSSDDLYKPRPTFTNNSRRRGAKNVDN